MGWVLDGVVARGLRRRWVGSRYVLWITDIWLVSMLQNKIPIFRNQDREVTVKILFSQTVFHTSETTSPSPSTTTLTPRHPIPSLIPPSPCRLFFLSSYPSTPRLPAPKPRLSSPTSQYPKHASN